MNNTTFNRILIIEDSIDRIKIFEKNILSINPKIEIVIVDNVKNAINEISQNFFDAIYFDHDLGEKNGDSVDIINYYIKIANNDKIINHNLISAQIIIHSANPIGSQNLYNKLRSLYNMYNMIENDFNVPNPISNYRIYILPLVWKNLTSLKRIHLD